MFQLDVKSTFLNGSLKGKVYVSQSPSFEIRGTKENVYKLKNALCDLKQAPRAWNKRIDGFLIHQKFVKCINEHAIYDMSSTNKHKLIVCLYVDDMLIVGSYDLEFEISRNA